MKHSLVREAGPEVRAEQIRSVGKWLPCHQTWSCWQISPPPSLWGVTTSKHYSLRLQTPHSTSSAVNPSSQWTTSPVSGKQSQGSHGTTGASSQIADTSQEMLSRHSKPCLVHHRQPSDLDSGLNKSINSIGLWERPMLFFFLFLLSYHYLHNKSLQNTINCVRCWK